MITISGPIYNFISHFESMVYHQGFHDTKLKSSNFPMWVHGLNAFRYNTYHVPQRFQDAPDLLCWHIHTQLLPGFPQRCGHHISVWWITLSSCKTKNDWKWEQMPYSTWYLLYSVAYFYPPTHLTSPLCLPFSVLERRVKRNAGSPSTEQRETRTAAHFAGFFPWLWLEPFPPFSASYSFKLGPSFSRHLFSFPRDRQSLQVSATRGAAWWTARAWTE